MDLRFKTRRHALIALVCLTLVAPASAQPTAPQPKQDHGVQRASENTSKSGSKNGAGLRSVRQVQFRDAGGSSTRVMQAVPPPTLEADLPPIPPTTGAVVSETPPNEFVAVPLPDGSPPVASSDAVFVPNLEAPFEGHVIEDQAALMYSTSDTYRRGFWYSQQDVVLLLRTGASDVPISFDNSTLMASSMISSKDVDPTYTPGTRLTLGRFLGQDVVNRDHTVEFTFFGLFDYSESAALVGVATNGVQTVLGPGNDLSVTGPPFDGTILQLIGPPVIGFSSSRRHDVLYESDFNSMELNYRIFTRPLRDRLALQPNGAWVHHAASSRLRSFLFGFRAMSVTELLRIDADFAQLRVGDTHSMYQVQTSNDMFGFQVGGEVFENYATWSWGLRFKGGALFNFADRRSVRDVFLDGVVTGTGEPQRDLLIQHLTQENMVGVIEAGLFASYQIRPNLLLRAGYDAMYLNGIATAPENAGLDVNFPIFEVSGDAIFHGATFGVEMLW